MTSERLPSPTESEFRPRLQGARRGEDSAWRALYDWLAPQVLGYLRASGIDDPEDVLGDVFLDVARSIRSFRGDARGFRAWVFTIARARRVDAIRRKSRCKEEVLDTGIHDALPSGTDVEAEALAIVGLDDMLALFDRLTDDQGEVLILRAIGGWSAREIGEITGRTTGSIEQLHHRARSALRELLDGS